MDIFISWSGERARKFALELKKYLKMIIHRLDPWVSNLDINKGTRWLKELSEKLEKTNFGIICLTPENLNAPWILFEAGALSKFVDKSLVCTVLLDFEPSLLKGPLSHFNATMFNKEDMFKLLTTINNSLEDEKLTESQLKESFNVWWPKLESGINEIGLATKKVKPERPDTDMIKETLDTVRRIEKQLSHRSGSFLFPEGNYRTRTGLMGLSHYLSGKDKKTKEEIIGEFAKLHSDDDDDAA